MKKIILTIIVFGIYLGVNAQKKVKLEDNTNANDLVYKNENLGIGTTSPSEKLHINGNIGIGIMAGTSNEGLKIEYVDGGSGTTTFQHGRWGGNIYFKRSSSLGERTQFFFGGSSNHFMDIYNSNNEVKLRLSSGGNSYFNGGNLGIGTTSPSEKLQIENGIIKIRNNNNANRFIWSRTDNSMMAGIAGDGARKMFFLADNSIRMTIDGLNGNVGIGTTIPDMKLTVNGNIHAKEVKIDLNIPAPDYVFKKDYNLKTIKEVEKFIKKNNHLPEIPSAKEFKKNGIMQAEMDMNLLKKIEELTLYTIQQQKEIEELKSLVKKLIEVKK